jgi:hypothetical protein
MPHHARTRDALQPPKFAEVVALVESEMAIQVTQQPRKRAPPYNEAQGIDVIRRPRHPADPRAGARRPAPKEHTYARTHG